MLTTPLHPVLCKVSKSLLSLRNSDSLSSSVLDGCGQHFAISYSCTASVFCVVIYSIWGHCLEELHFQISFLALWPWLLVPHLEKAIKSSASIAFPGYCWTKNFLQILTWRACGSAFFFHYSCWSCFDYKRSCGCLCVLICNFLVFPPILVPDTLLVTSVLLHECLIWSLSWMVFSSRWKKVAHFHTKGEQWRYL